MATGDFNPSRIPLIGGFFPDTDAQALQDQYRRMADAYRQYRGFAADAAQKRYDSQIISTGPMREVLSRMMPTLRGFDLQTPGNAFASLTGGRGPAAVAPPRPATPPPAQSNGWQPAGPYPLPAESGPGGFIQGGPSLVQDPTTGRWIKR